jgi:hypothetical protein
MKAYVTYVSSFNKSLVLLAQIARSGTTKQPHPYLAFQKQVRCVSVVSVVSVVVVGWCSTKRLLMLRCFVSRSKKRAMLQWVSLLEPCLLLLFNECLDMCYCSRFVIGNPACIRLHSVAFGCIADDSDRIWSSTHPKIMYIINNSYTCNNKSKRLPKKSTTTKAWSRTGPASRPFTAASPTTKSNLYN